MKYLLLVPLIVIVMSGCATRPENIQASEVPYEKYMGSSCVELASKLSDAKSELVEVSKLQDSKATSDTWISIITIVPPSALTGDYETDIAQYKGEMTAIEQAQMKKECN